MILTPVAERLAAEQSLPVLTTYVCRDWESKPQPSGREANTLTDCATAAAYGGGVFNDRQYILLCLYYISMKKKQLCTS